MSTAYTLQIGQRGVLTFPKSVREAYKMQPGDSVTMLDLGGVFILSPSPQTGYRVYSQPTGASFSSKSVSISVFNSRTLRLI